MESTTLGPPDHPLVRVTSEPLVETTPDGKRHWHLLSLIGRWYFLLPATVAVALLGHGQGRSREAGQLLAGVALAAVATNLVLKPLVKGPRPEGHAPIEIGYGFPSGHSSAALAFGRLAPRALLGGARARGTAITLGLVFAALMGIARVAVTAHDWEDVLGGWMLGALAGAAVRNGL